MQMNYEIDSYYQIYYIRNEIFFWLPHVTFYYKATIQTKYMYQFKTTIKHLLDWHVQLGLLLKNHGIYISDIHS
jgi:hypothetical protein